MLTSATPIDTRGSWLIVANYQLGFCDARADMVGRYPNSIQDADDWSNG